MTHTLLVLLSLLTGLLLLAASILPCSGLILLTTR
jgi:hypothetical protein